MTHSLQFWELHRKLGECYEADVRNLSHSSGVHVTRVRSDVSSSSRRVSDRASDHSRKDLSSQEVWPIEPGIRAAAPPREGSFVPEPPS
eukprot:s2666_g1.t1